MSIEFNAASIWSTSISIELVISFFSNFLVHSIKAKSPFLITSSIILLTTSCGVKDLPKILIILSLIWGDAGVLTIDLRISIDFCASSKEYIGIINFPPNS